MSDETEFHVAAPRCFAESLPLVTVVGLVSVLT